MSDVKSINSVSKPAQSTNSAQNTVGDDAGNSWATTISQYLLQRRAQTQTAYQSQLLPNSSDESGDMQDWLFETLFEVLVQRLEEGHTVLALDAFDNFVSGEFVSADNGLFAWQQQLLQPLVQPLWSAFANTNMTDISINELLEEDSIWESALRQSTLSAYDKRILEQRRKACVKLYHSLKGTASSTDSVKNSLSNFSEL